MPILFLFIALVTMALVSYSTNISPFISFGVGIGLGLILMLFIIGKLGKRAYSSPLCREIVFKITAYSPQLKPVKEQVIKINNDDDYKEAQAVLREKLKFTPAETRKALDYVVTTFPDATLEVKIREAIKYLGNGHKELVGDKG